VTNYLTLIPITATQYTVHFFSAISGMGRQRGSVNCKNEVLIQIVKGIFPNSELAWQAVAIAYQGASSEEKLRDWDGIKKDWIHNLCNGMKKPTSSMGGRGYCIHIYIAINK
jgi:hypothetical protein